MLTTNVFDVVKIEGVNMANSHYLNKSNQISCLIVA